MQNFGFKKIENAAQNVDAITTLSMIAKANRKLSVEGKTNSVQFDELTDFSKGHVFVNPMMKTNGQVGCNDFAIPSTSPVIDILEALKIENNGILHDGKYVQRYTFSYKKLAFITDEFVKSCKEAVENQE